MIKYDYQTLSQSTIVQLWQMEETFWQLNKKFDLGIEGLEGKVSGTGKSYEAMNHLEKLAHAALKETKEAGKYWYRADIIRDFTKYMVEVREKMVTSIKQEFEAKLATIDKVDDKVLEKVKNKTKNNSALSDATEEFEWKKWFTFTAAANPLPIHQVVEAVTDGLDDNDVIMFDYSGATSQRAKDYAKQHSPDYPKAYLKKWVDQNGNETLVIIWSTDSNGKEYRGRIREGVKMSTDKSAAMREDVALTHEQEAHAEHVAYQKHFDVVQDLQGLGIRLERADAALLMKSIDSRLQYFINQCRNLDLNPDADDVMTALDWNRNSGFFEFHAKYPDGSGYDQYFLKNDQLNDSLNATLREGDNSTKLLHFVKDLWKQRYKQQILQWSEKEKRVHFEESGENGTNVIHASLDISFETPEQAQRAKQYIDSELQKAMESIDMKTVPVGHKPFSAPNFLSNFSLLENAYDATIGEWLWLVHFDTSDWWHKDLFTYDEQYKDLYHTFAKKQNIIKLVDFMNEMFAKKYQDQINQQMEQETWDTFDFTQNNDLQAIQSQVEGLMKEIKDVGHAHSGFFGGLNELQKAQVSRKEQQIREGIKRMEALLSQKGETLAALEEVVLADPNRKSELDDATMDFNNEKEKFLDTIQQYNEIVSRTGGKKSGIQDADHLEALATKGREDMSFAIQHISYEIEREKTPEWLIQFLWDKMKRINNNTNKTGAFTANVQYVHALEKAIFEKINAMDDITPEQKKKQLLLLIDICRDDVSGNDFDDVWLTGIDNRYKNYALAEEIMQTLFLGENGIVENMTIQPTHSKTETMNTASRNELFNKFAAIWFTRPTWANKPYKEMTMEEKVYLGALSDMVDRFPDMGTDAFNKKFATNPEHYVKMFVLTIKNTTHDMMNEFGEKLMQMNEYASNLGLSGIDAAIYDKFSDMKGMWYFDFSDTNIDFAQQWADVAWMLTAAVISSIAAAASFGSLTWISAATWAGFASAVAWATVGSMVYDAAAHGKARENATERRDEAALTFAMDAATLGMFKWAGKILQALAKYKWGALEKALTAPQSKWVYAGKRLEEVGDFAAGMEGERLRQKWLYNEMIDVQSMIENWLILAALSKYGDMQATLSQLPQTISYPPLKNIIKKVYKKLGDGVWQMNNNFSNILGDNGLSGSAKATMQKAKQKLQKLWQTIQQPFTGSSPTGWPAKWSPEQTAHQRGWEKTQKNTYHKQWKKAQKLFAGRDSSQYPPLLQRFARGDDIGSFTQGEVREIQELVGHQGNNDGILGPQTFDSIKKYVENIDSVTQKVNDIEAQAAQATTPQKAYNVLKKIGWLLSLPVVYPLSLVKKLYTIASSMLAKINTPGTDFALKKKAQEIMNKLKDKLAATKESIKDKLFAKKEKELESDAETLATEQQATKFFQKLTSFFASSKTISKQWLQNIKNSLQKSTAAIKKLSVFKQILERIERKTAANEFIQQWEKQGYMVRIEKTRKDDGKIKISWVVTKNTATEKGTRRGIFVDGTLVHGVEEKVIIDNDWFASNTIETIYRNGIKEEKFTIFPDGSIKTTQYDINGNITKETIEEQGTTKDNDEQDVDQEITEPIEGIENIDEATDTQEIKKLEENIDKVSTKQEANTLAVKIKKTVGHMKKFSKSTLATLQHIRKKLGSLITKFPSLKESQRLLRKKEIEVRFSSQKNAKIESIEYVDGKYVIKGAYETKFTNWTFSTREWEFLYVGKKNNFGSPFALQNGSIKRFRSGGSLDTQLTGTFDQKTWILTEGKYELYSGKGRSVIETWTFNKLGYLEGGNCKKITYDNISGTISQDEWTFINEHLINGTKTVQLKNWEKYKCIGEFNGRHPTNAKGKVIYHVERIQNDSAETVVRDGERKDGHFTGTEYRTKKNDQTTEEKYYNNKVIEKDDDVS